MSFTNNSITALQPALDSIQQGSTSQGRKPRQSVRMKKAAEFSELELSHLKKGACTMLAVYIHE